VCITLTDEHFAEVLQEREPVVVVFSVELNLRTIVLDNAGERSAALDIGGTITLTDVVENYPGFVKLTGQELAQKMEEHARDYSQVAIKNAWATSIDRQEDCFVVHTGEEVVQATTFLFAPGTRHRELDVPGHDQFRNKGVQYCALCDGPLYKEKVVGVVGGSDSAAKEALLLAEYASQVYLIARGAAIKPEPINKMRIEQHPRIRVITGANVVRIEGGQQVERAILDRSVEDQEHELSLDALFIAIGVIPLSELAVPLGVKTNPRGEIMIDRDSRTNIPGIYAADVTDRAFKQAITGVSEGVVAAYSAYQDLKNDMILAYDDEEAHPHVHEPTVAS
jgi:thioredoxin reductase